MQTVINNLNKLNSRNKAILIFTFDFYTLYTNIPHNQVKSATRKESSSDSVPMFVTKKIIGITRSGAI